MAFNPFYLFKSSLALWILPLSSGAFISRTFSRVPEDDGGDREHTRGHPAITGFAQLGENPNQNHFLFGSYGGRGEQEQILEAGRGWLN